MTTLYKRATPPQARILRAVAGAVKNAADAHPEYGLDEYMARSIAKRACGTISSQMAGLLAAQTVRGFVPSERAVLTCTRADRMRLSGVKSHDALKYPVNSGPRGSLTRFNRRSPLRLLIRDLGIMAGEARRAGKTERLEALADVLRLMSKLT